MSEEAKWYVVHTYSGYENKVKSNIEKVVENRNLQDLIPEVMIPMEEVTEVKGNKIAKLCACKNGAYRRFMVYR